MKSTVITSIQHRRTSVIKEVPPQFHVHQQDVGTLVRIQDNWCEHEAVLVNVEDGDSLKLSKKLFLQECTDTTAPTLDDATQIFIILIRKNKVHTARRLRHMLIIRRAHHPQSQASA